MNNSIALLTFIALAVCCFRDLLLLVARRFQVKLGQLSILATQLILKCILYFLISENPINWKFCVSLQKETHFPDESYVPVS